MTAIKSRTELMSMRVRWAGDMTENCMVASFRKWYWTVRLYRVALVLNLESGTVVMPQFNQFSRDLRMDVCEVS